jgi:signal peptidase I
MCNTLNYRNNICHNGYGEYLIITKLGYIVGSPQRGDIVVFRPPGTEQFNRIEALFRTLLHIDGQDYFIKRIIGLPGETVELKNGYVYVNGKRLSESYLSKTNEGHTYPLVPGKTTFKVPEGSYLVLGDNRQVSTDSRSCFRSSSIGGCRTEADSFITPSSMEGKAWLILFPLDTMGTIKNPEYHLQTT